MPTEAADEMRLELLAEPAYNIRAPFTIWPKRLALIASG
jgi:hypothetical protein